MIDPLSTSAFVADACFAGLAFVFMAALVRSNDKRRALRFENMALHQEKLVLEAKLKASERDADTLATANLRLSEVLRFAASAQKPTRIPAGQPGAGRFLSTKAGAATAG